MNEQWAANSNGIFPTDAGANGMLDGGMFGQPNVDLSQFQNAAALQQQRMQNGTPAFQNPQYNVNPVIPSKRPRPTEDGIAASPRQPPHLNLSRSQTPHQPQGFQGFPGNQQPHNPYQHLQQGGSGNATPSPTPQDAQFRPPTAQQRMNASPSPFPGAQPGMAMSPPPDANGSRVGTPHNPSFPMGGMGMTPSSMPQGHQNFGGMQGMNPAAQMAAAGTPQGIRLSQNLAQQQAETQRMYQMRLMQQQQAMAANNAQQRGQMAMGNPMAAPGQPGNIATPSRNPQQHAMQAQSFMKTLQAFMAQQNKPFDPAPVVGGRQINLYQLYLLVMRARGSQMVTSRNGWPALAQAIGFQVPNVAQQVAPELRNAYERNLGPYESAFWRAKQDPSKQGMVNPMQAGQQNMNQQMSPTRPQAAGASELQQQQALLQQQYLAQMQQRAQAQAQGNQMGQMTPVQNNAPLPATNGWSTPQTDPASGQRQGSMGPGKSIKSEASPAVQHPGVAGPPSSAAEKFPDGQPAAPSTTGAQPVEAVKEEHPVDRTTYKPAKFILQEHYGGYTVKTLTGLGAQIDMHKPMVPDFEEMGMVDIRALSLSLQSGIDAEIRYALDHLIKLSNEQRFFAVELERSEDLVDVLIEFAEEQVEALREDAPEVSDILDMTPYEELVRSCKVEVEGIQDIPDFATSAYDLNRAADRLVAVTTILRNLSFWPTNQSLMASEHVVKFLSSTIKNIGMRWQLLRSHTNTQDFMKDVIVFLSNVADKIELPSREDALNILHFLCAFAPQPQPTASPKCRFTRYNPALHRYLPPAVDSLAKLLARDDPNRAYYKYLFANDPASLDSKAPPHQQYELLTKAFGLAISVIPDRGARSLIFGTPSDYRISEVRKPYLIQGMLAADILASLIPATDAGLARTWLEAEDGWAVALLRLSAALSKTPAPPAPVRPGQPPQRQPDHELGFGLVTYRALGMLLKLGEKTRSELSLNGLHPSHGGATGSKEKQTNGDSSAHETHEGEGEAEAAVNGKAKEVAEMDEDDEEDGDDVDDVEKRTRRLARSMGDILPQQEVLLGALISEQVDVQALNQLFQVAALQK